MLTTAPASFSFASGTPGICYLLLTAYRIETLRQICFVTLLENTHELMWSMHLKTSYIVYSRFLDMFYLV
jgi:hypothetical protein